MQTADPVAGGEPVRRTLEIEEFTNRIFVHPVAGRLVLLFARVGITPNAVSLFGMACGLGAGWAYYHDDRPALVVAGFCLMIVWHVMDGADGQLARLTHAQSDIGRVLDGICDYVTFIGVYVALALRLSGRHGAWVWGLVVLAGLCHAIQSAAYEKQREEYQAWGRGRTPATDTQPGDPRPAHGLGRLFRQLSRSYARVQSLSSVPGPALRQTFAAALGRHPGRAAALRDRYRSMFAPALRRWSVLSANYRTIGIFVATICGVPLAYFVFEIVGFGLVLAVLLATQRRLYRCFCASLDPRQEQGPAQARRNPVLREAAAPNLRD